MLSKYWRADRGGRVAGPISRWNADSAAFYRRSDAGRPVGGERDAVQVANPQKVIWTRVKDRVHD